MMNATGLKITLLFIFDDRNDDTVERRMLDILEKYQKQGCEIEEQLNKLEDHCNSDI